MSIDTLPLTDVLAETATLYETVAALPSVVERVEVARHSGKPSSQPPPGAADLLDMDEYHRAVTDVDEWALFLAHVLVDEVDGIGSVPDGTPGRLRLASRWADKLEAHDDTHLRYAIGLDAREHLVVLRRMSKRGTRVVNTRSACLSVSCPGTFVATIAGPDVDDDLVCDRCGSRVPRDQWERWGSRAEWVTPERAASILGISKAAVWQRASREDWRRTGTHRDVRYHRDDVTSGIVSAMQGTSVS